MADLEPLSLTRCASLQDFLDFRSAEARTLRWQRRREAELVGDHFAAFELPGVCAVCRAAADFQVTRRGAGRVLPDGRVLPNWREDIRCPRCGLINRARAALHILEQEAAPGPDARIFVTEQRSRLFDRLRARWPNATGSEFLGPERSPGEVVDDVRHEDLQRLSFADASFDVVLTLDVLEHVPEPSRALAEIHRVLGPGGVLLASVPFRGGEYEPLVRARLTEGGAVEHLMEPERHGDPVRPGEGALVFQVPGFRLLDDLRGLGFEGVEALYYWSESYGYLGAGQMVIIARKA